MPPGGGFSPIAAIVSANLSTPSNVVPSPPIAAASVAALAAALLTPVELVLVFELELVVAQSRHDRKPPYLWMGEHSTRAAKEPIHWATQTVRKVHTCGVRARGPLK
jgi:hypothetical protein